MSRFAKAIDAIRKSIVPIRMRLGEKPIKNSRGWRVERQNRDGRVVTQQPQEHSIASNDLLGRRRSPDVGVAA